MLTMAPLPCASITGSTCLQPRNTLLRLKSTWRVPDLFVHLDRAAGGRAADVVDQDVDAAEGADAGGHHRGHAVASGDVAGPGCAACHVVVLAPAPDPGSTGAAGCWAAREKNHCLASLHQHQVHHGHAQQGQEERDRQRIEAQHCRPAGTAEGRRPARRRPARRRAARGTGGCARTGTRRVRIAKMISVWVAIDSTNQPARNSPGTASNTHSIRANVAKSNTELIGPKRNMKRRMKAMSQCDGRQQLLLVHPVAGDGQLAGVVEQVVEQDLARQHRQEAAAPRRPSAALNMLPKLLDVPISTYLMVLAKIRRPSMTPSASTPRSLSSSTTSAASLATSVAAVDGDADVGLVQRERVVDAVAQERRPRRRSARSSRMIRAFCSGETRAKMLASRRGGAQLRVGHGLEPRRR